MIRPTFLLQTDRTKNRARSEVDGMQSYFRFVHKSSSQLHELQSTSVYSVRQKKYPLKFFAIFSATARNFYMKFHTFITHS